MCVFRARAGGKSRTAFHASAPIGHATPKKATCRSDLGSAPAACGLSTVTPQTGSHAGSKLNFIRLATHSFSSLRWLP
jgi:hypothetical protein